MSNKNARSTPTMRKPPSTVAGTHVNLRKFTISRFLHRMIHQTLAETTTLCLCHNRHVDQFDRAGWCGQEHIGTALRILGQVCGVSPVQMVAFGDSYNDIPMLELVTSRYVVKNASTGMQQHARFLAESNNGYGMLKVMDEVLADR